MENPLYSKSKRLALDIIQLYRYLVEQKGEYVISKQLLRSGTSVGANIRESKRAQSEADCISKLSIALKEAEETQYWIELLSESSYIDGGVFDSINTQVDEMIKILVTIIRTKKDHLQQTKLK